MDKYILQLLKLHSKIILPDFGAIVIADDETGELMFNEFLNYNDNKLAELVEQESNMDLQEAQNNVAKFVRELKYHLDKGEVYTIYQLGEFYKEKDEYLFSGNIKTGKSDRPKEEQTSPVVSTKTEEKVKKKTENIKSKAEKKDIPPAVTSKKKKKAEADDAAQLKKNIYKEKKEKESSIPASSTNDTKEEVTASTTNAQKDEEKVEERKRKPLIGLIILLIIVLGVFFAIYFNQDRISSYMGWDKFDDVENITEEDNTIDNDLNAETDNLAAQEEGVEENLVESDHLTDEHDEIIEGELNDDELIDKQIVEEIQSSQTVAPTSPIGSYHIVVGAFSEEKNALGLVEELKSQGFNASVIGQFTSQQLYYVAAGSYSSLSSAKAELSNVTRVKESAWIFKR